MISERSYRSDIDGLRAIAVMAVFLFHLDFDFASGGYIGVDVFYVISGFVIFRGLLNVQVRDLEFVRSFYVRRVRRIAPALMLTVVATLVAGYFIMTPGEYLPTARSALAATFAASNIYFAQAISYFAGGAKSMPLLHTWSLGVEEQFYIAVPWLAYLFWRAGRDGSLLSVVAAVTLASFIYCVAASFYFFDARHAFYMPMSRVWEIGAGALVAFAERRFSPGRLLSAFMTAFGFGLLGWSIATFDDRTIFPGTAALLPVLATVSLILARPAADALSMKVLGSWPLRFLGRISYSLYLQHWPYVVFIGLILGRPFELHEKFLLLAAAIATSYLAWRFVEEPCRDRSRMTPTFFRPVAVAAITATSLLAALVIVTRGAPGRLVPEARALETWRAEARKPAECKPSPDFPRIRRAHVCGFGAEDQAPEFVIWGDSHADMFAPYTAAALNGLGVSGLSVTMPDCHPLLDVHFSKRKNQRECEALATAVLQRARSGRLKFLILSSRWASLGSHVRAPGDGATPKVIYRNSDGGIIPFDAALRHTVDQFIAAGVRILIIGPTPELEFDAPNSLIRSLQFASALPFVSRDGFDSRQSLVMRALAGVSDKPGVRIVYPHDLLCGDKACRYHDARSPYYFDDDHLSAEGVAQVLPAIVAGFRKLQSGQ